ncbi:Ribose import ATP-binding protein RbsA [Symmachiella dynata]|nr:Ribose import ATP-binding protein RbsA [Symmachiella dynata]
MVDIPRHVHNVMTTPLLKLTGIAKSFGGVPALKPFSLELAAGSILGLVGENGAGKSTLIKLLSGLHQPNAGTITLGGRSLRFESPRAAIDAGIATIHQELEYAAQLTVAENLLLGESWPRSFFGGVNWRSLHEEAQERLRAFGIDLPTHATMDQLTAAEKQEVSIAAALSRDAQLLILDEPTASLSEPEVRRLFGHLTKLQARGVAIIYVSHRLDEIFEITDRIAVLRDGDLVATHATAEVTAGQLVHDMVGRPLDQVYPRTRSGELGGVVLQLQSLTRARMFRDISLDVRAGEIVGVAGLVGAGRSELARAIYGLYPPDSGTMTLNGNTWKPRDAHAALRGGLVYIPEERKRQGLVLDHSLRESLSIGFAVIANRLGIVNRRRERAMVSAALTNYDIRATGPEQAIGTLSGGNQQKALIARWLERDPGMIILDEPTRGVDVGAKADIHAHIDRLAGAGKGVLFISSDLPELIGMSDRVLVMNRGTMETELSGENLTEHNVILAASGLSPTDAPATGH